MKKLLTACVSIFFIFIQNGFSQELKIEKANFNYLIGASASSVSGAGPSLIYCFNDSFHLLITGCYYEKRTEITDDLTGEKAFNKNIWGNGGIELRKIIAQSAKPGLLSQYFLLAGGSYWDKEKKRPFYPKDNMLRRYYSAGCGLGVNLIISYKVAISADICYQFSDWIKYGKRYAGIGGGAGVYLCF